MQAEARAEGLAEGRAEGQAEIKKRYEERLARIAAEAREKGITLESLNGLARETE